MEKYRFKEVFTGFTKMQDAVISISNGKIEFIEKYDKNKHDERVNEVYKKHTVLPGFIDEHNHGGYGIDFSETTVEDVSKLMEYFPQEGITTVVPTVGALKKDEIEYFIDLIKEYVNEKELGKTNIAGIHLEGPFLNPEKAGMIDPEAMIEPSAELVQKWIDQSNGLLKIMTIAPELPKSLDVIRLLSKHSIVAAAGHSNATIEEMNKGVEAGVSQITHLFNGMRTLHHREPGILGVGLTNENIFAEMVGFDTYSIHPTMWKMLYQLKGPNRVILSTDANTVKGLPEGKYMIKGREIEYKNGRIYTPYQGSDMHPGVPMTFIGTVNNTMKYTGARLEDIAVMASVNPAKQIGIFDKKGSLTEGKDADFIVLDEGNGLIATYCNGICAYSSEQE